MSYAIKNTSYDGELFLSCLDEIDTYYKELGFSKIETYPERFQDTIDWSIKEKTPYCVMKLE